VTLLPLAPKSSPGLRAGLRSSPLLPQGKGKGAKNRARPLDGAAGIWYFSNEVEQKQKFIKIISKIAVLGTDFALSLIST
jgi:hypothetical protein